MHNLLILHFKNDVITTIRRYMQYYFIKISLNLQLITKHNILDTFKHILDFLLRQS
jgi:hypothetical protein